MGVRDIFPDDFLTTGFLGGNLNLVLGCSLFLYTGLISCGSILMEPFFALGDLNEGRPGDLKDGRPGDLGFFIATLVSFMSSTFF